MTRKYKFLFLMLLMSFFSYAQGQKQKMANKAFARYQYANASVLYEQLVSKDSSNKEALEKLAVCYFKMNDTRKAERIYKRLYKESESDTTVMLNYAQVLAKNGRYEESKEIYRKYLAKQYKIRASLNVEALKEIKSLYKDSANFKIYLTKYNSLQSDFAPTPYQKGIVFSSSREEGLGSKRVYGWDNSAYLDLYYADTTGIDTTKRFRTNTWPEEKDQSTYADFENSYGMHPDESYKTSNDTRTLGYHGVFFAVDSTWLNKDTTGPAYKFDKKINTKYHEGPACFLGDTVVYFTRNSYNGWGATKGTDNATNLNIYVSYLRDGKWTKAEMLSICNKNYSTGHPSISRDGQWLYFASNMPGGVGGTDLYRAKFDNGQWTNVENLGKTINTEGDEFFPYIDSLNTLYFTSNGQGGMGGLDIFKVGLVDMKKLTVKNLGFPINSKKDDFGLIISNNGKSGFFSSNRKRGGPDDDIFYFTQQTFKPFKLKVIVKSQLDSTGLPQAKITLCETMSKNIRKDSVADDMASMSYLFKKPSDKSLGYTVVLSKPGYYSDTISLPPAYFAKAEGKLIDTVIYLKKIRYVVYCGTVLDKKTKKPIDNAQLYVFNMKTHMLDTLHADANGKFCRNLEPATTYVMKAEKLNYFPDCYKVNVPDVKTVCKTQSDYNLTLTKIGLNTTFEVKNLLYDYNKADIRQDAAVILETLMEDVLNAYPTIKVELGAHTDSRGKDDYNKKLSQKRADSAVAYIKRHGISKMRIVSKGYGESKVLNKCKNGVKCSELEHQINRRTEIKVIGFLKPSEYEAAGITNLLSEGHKFDVKSDHNECPLVQLKVKEEL